MATCPPCIDIPTAHGPVQAAMRVPGGKSPANRALLLAAVADGPSTVGGLPDSDDTSACLAALAALGVAATRDGDTARVAGGGGGFANPSGTIRIGDAGTVGRFLPGLLAAAPEGDWILEAGAQLSGRPLAPLLDGLRQWGARLGPLAPGASFPLRVRGGGLAGGRAKVSAAGSSQFASGLLLAAPLARAAAEVVVADADPGESYFDLTLELMRAFGVEAERRPAAGGAQIFAVPPQRYRPRDYSVPADANTAGYFFALAAATGGAVTVGNLDAAAAPPGIGFLEILERMGCRVERRAAGGVRVDGPPRGQLRGGFAVDLRTLAESAPTLAALACFADAPVEMRNLAHIRGHETDRLKALAELLPAFGADTEEYPDGLRVAPPARGIQAPRIDPRGDHRLAMALAVTAAAGAGGMMENPGCVAKTCPDFFRLLAEALG